MTQIIREQIEKTRQSGMVDEKWYVGEYPDVKVLGMDPVEHYVRIGAAMGRRPSADYMKDLKKAHGLESASAPAFVATPRVQSPASTLGRYYAEMRQDIITSGFWDERWYLARYYSEYTDFKKHNYTGEYFAPVDHYLLVGWRKGYQPSDRLPLDIDQAKVNQNKISHFLDTVRFAGYHFDRNIWLPSNEMIEGYNKYRNNRISKKVVYTCIVEHYDDLMQPFYIDREWDYICYTNSRSLIDSRKVGVWEIRSLIEIDSDPAKSNRWHKMHPHILFPEYDQSIYIDGNINIISSYIYDEIANRDIDILLPQHFTRKCIYRELKTLVRSPRFDDEQKEKFRSCEAFLRREGFPEDYGLMENNVIYRRHESRLVRKMMEAWWLEYNAHPPRDQTTLAYVFWKNQLAIAGHTFANCRVNYRDFWMVKHNTPSTTKERVVTEIISPAFNERNVAVVFSTNERYVPYLGVAIYSLIDNTVNTYNYDIIILSNNLSKESEKKLSALANRRNISIRFYNMASIYESLPSDIFHVEGYVPVETYNKCFLTEFLSGYDRCVYLDSDIIVLDDIRKLHDMPLDGFAIGASPNIANINAAYAKKIVKGKQFDVYLDQELGVRNHEEYFQAGVLVLDMKTLRSMNFVDKAMDALRDVSQPIFFDQCIFNKIFYGDVKFFSTEWNHVWYMQNYSYLKSSMSDKLFYDYARSRVAPKIVHYASKDKPHTKRGWDLADLFWNYAYKSPFLDQILRELGESKNEVAAAFQEVNGDQRDSWYRVAPRILIHAHIYYSEQTDLIIDCLRNIVGCHYSLHVTMPERNSDCEAKLREFSKEVIFHVVPNAGYDVYPFLYVIQQVRLAEYHYILKIHTKNRRDPGQDSVYGITVPGFTWRDELLDALLGSPEVFARNVELLSSDKETGMLGAERFVFSTSENREEVTYKLPEWRAKCGIVGGRHYVGGSMFLAHSYPFEKLKALRMKAEDFEAPQMATKDYRNKAHIFERLFGLVVESEGFTVRGVSGAHSEKLHSTRYSQITVPKS